MKLFKLSLISIFTITSLSACFGKTPVEVQLTTNPLNSMMGVEYPPIINVGSKVDDITVESVKINRGNCKASGDGKHLQFGQTARFNTFSCQIKEVEVFTDKGSYSFTF